MNKKSGTRPTKINARPNHSPRPCERDLERKLADVRKSLSDAALELYTANPWWKQYYAEAPEHVKPFIKAMFVEGTMAYLETKTREWTSISGKMSADDWSYLRDHTVNQMARATYRKIAEHVASSGKPVPTGALEIPNLFFNMNEDQR